MLVYVATSLDLSWFLGLFCISDHSNEVDESNSSRGYILLTILIALVLFKFYWTGENKEVNSNINEADDEEEEQQPPRNVIPCAFCGNSSTTRCARCKVARYW